MSDTAAEYFAMPVFTAPEVAGIPQFDGPLAVSVSVRVMKSSLLELRMGAWHGDCSADDVAAVTDALHNLPDFLCGADRSAVFDHHYFIRVTAAPMVSPGGSASRLRMRISSTWKAALSDAYGAELISAVYPEAKPQ